MEQRTANAADDANPRWDADKKITFNVAPSDSNLELEVRGESQMYNALLGSLKVRLASLPRGQWCHVREQFSHGDAGEIEAEILIGSALVASDTRTYVPQVQAVRLVEPRSISTAGASLTVQMSEPTTACAASSNPLSPAHGSPMHGATTVAHGNPIQLSAPPPVVRTVASGGHKQASWSPPAQATTAACQSRVVEGPIETLTSMNSWGSLPKSQTQTQTQQVVAVRMQQASCGTPLRMNSLEVPPGTSPTVGRTEVVASRAYDPVRVVRTVTVVPQQTSG